MVCKNSLRLHLKNIFGFFFCFTFGPERKLCFFFLIFPWMVTQILIYRIQSYASPDQLIWQTQNNVIFMENRNIHALTPIKSNSIKLAWLMLTCITPNITSRHINGIPFIELFKTSFIDTLTLCLSFSLSVTFSFNASFYLEHLFERPFHDWAFKFRSTR